MKVGGTMEEVHQVQKSSILDYLSSLGPSIHPKKMADPTIMQLHQDLNTAHGLTLGQLAGQLKDDIILTQPANISPLFSPNICHPRSSPCALAVTSLSTMWSCYEECLA
jgi:hypothetical protein